MSATEARQRAYDHLRRADIAARIGIAPDGVTPDHLWHYAMGDMDEGASCVTWFRAYRPPVARGITDGGEYPILPFPDPRPLVTTGGAQ